jgi:Spy/CpxP family protein refolding chaperone
MEHFMRKAIIILTLTAFALTNLQGISFGQTLMNSAPDANIVHIKRQGIKNKLNLTADQQAKVRAIKEESKTELKPLMDQISVERQKLKVMLDGKADKNALHQQREKILSIRKQIQAIRKEHLAKFEHLLTPVQKAQFAQIKKQNEEKYRKHMAINREKRIKEHFKKILNIKNTNKA